jgi:protein-histidine pros-kinase
VKLPLPRTLFARLILIWLFGMALVLAVSFALFLGERDRYGRDVLFEGITREIVAAVDVLDRLSAEDRAEWIETLGRRRLRLSLRPPPSGAQPMPQAAPLLRALQVALPGREVALFAHQRRGAAMPHHLQPFVTLSLADGEPLTIRLPGPAFAGRPPPPPERLLTALLALVAGVTGLTWLAVRIATRPISRLAAAARALGEDPGGAPMETDGSVEVAQAAQAFNLMQQRIRDHVGERTRILAAISHDLLTPITRLRLRAELVDDEGLRAKIQSDLDAMQAIAREGLDYARSLEATAAAQPIDLNALAATLCDDATDMGWEVRCSGTVQAPCLGRLDALRRALANLIENGVKFGGRVEVHLGESPAGFEIRIRDHGPGLPDAELEKVFEPFYRTEASRNRETGGTGLGLAIARNLIRAHGGNVRLENAAEGGGLEAIVTLPRRAAGGGGSQ